ncbi:hypothetical protein VNI00_004883 [Paramarasmius palmivorus]|uniref:Uncharacterized protein n=1 Tax=Paramarasmius palmivorus TaxID=297713 RepID=A0AAW0DJ84_9AGAR
MIPHLENVLETLPASVAISAILGRWGVPMWTEVSKLDVGRPLRYPDLVERWPEPVMKEPSLHHHGGNELLFSQQYWKAWMDFFQTPLSHPDNSGGNFSYFEDIITNSRLKRSIGLCFVIPFPIIDALWSHPNLVLRKQSLRLLQHAEESWKPYPGYDEKRHDMERITFAGSLAKHINRTDCTSQLLSSKRGQIFIQFIHDEIIARRLYSHVNFFVVGWRQAIQRTQEIGRLSPGYFKPIPRYGEDPPTATPSTGIQAIRYSVETEQSVQYHVAVLIDDPQTSNGGGEGTSAHSPTRIEHELRQSGVPRDSGDEQVNGTPASGEIVRDGSRKGMLGQLEWNLKLMTGPNTLRYYPP